MTPSRRRMLVLLDRDGVINYDSPEYIKNPDELTLIPGAAQAISDLTKHGIIVAVVSNQSGVGRGYFSADTLDAMFAKIQKEVQLQGGAISHFYYCPHAPDDDCSCRKPKPGMILQALHDFDVAPHHTWLLGDSARDIQAARAAGVHAVLVRSGNGTATEAEWETRWKEPAPETYQDLPSATGMLLAKLQSLPEDTSVASPPITVISIFRSWLFLLCWALSTIPYSSALMIGMATGASLAWRYQVASAWGSAAVWLAKKVCGIQYRVLHASAITPKAGIVLSNHQSAFETIAFISLLPSTAFIVKRELLRIPFFGAGLQSIKPIAIDRSKKRASLDQLVTQGRACLRSNRLVLVFPEGTRTPITVTRKYQRGGTHLADALGAPMQLVAHNAGKYWGNAWWQKRPGVVTFSFGPRLVAGNDNRYTLSRDWIETEKARLLQK